MDNRVARIGALRKYIAHLAHFEIAHQIKEASFGACVSSELRGADGANPEITQFLVQLPKRG